MSNENPTISAEENWMASCFVRVHMVVDLPSQTELNKGDHYMLLQEGCGEIWCCLVCES